MKVVGWLFVVIILVVLGAGAYLFLYSGDLVKQGIEEFGPQYLGTDVGVSSVDLDLAGGAGSIKGLEVGNPQGFSGPYAMRLGEIGLALDIEQTTSELVVIKEMRIVGASLVAIAEGRNTNLQKIMENVEAAAGTSEAGPADAGGSEMKFIVDRFLFTDADVSLKSDILGESSLSIPPIELSGVGRKTNGATAAELAQQLMKPITEAVSRAAVSEGLDLEGVKANAKEKLMDKVRDKVPGVDKLKDLF